MASAAEPVQPALPIDLLHLLAQQLSDNNDFPTLYNCIVSSKQLASAGAIAALYRISHKCQINSGASDNLALAEQELNVQKWSILWRTITLSAMGKTLYPYCRHMRVLDLQDLGYLLEDDKFRGKISKNFFAGPLAPFNLTLNTPAKMRNVVRLDRGKIISAIGDELTNHTPLLEVILEPMLLPILSTALLTWAPRLPHLRRLQLFDGKGFADETFRNLLHAHCPNLESLTLYSASDSETDHSLALFISGMPENRLISFDSLGDIGIGAETYLAMNNHGQSLKSLKLRLNDEGILSLGLLRGCSAIETLTIGSERGYIVDLKATQNDVYLEIMEWLKSCLQLKELEFHNIASAADIVGPVLLSNSLQLEELTINSSKDECSYTASNHGDFHRSLRTQLKLKKLLLRAESDPPSRDQIEIFVDSLCTLKELTHLNLIRIADYFNEDNISLLGRCLLNLDTLYVGGFGCSDGALNGLVGLSQLKSLTFSTLSRFTSTGLSDYIDALGQGNTGLIISIESADSDYGITEEELRALQELIQVKLGGRLEYQYLRDPNVPEFDTDDDSD